MLKALLQELKSKKAPLWGLNPQKSPLVVSLTPKSPPCAKGDVSGADRGIVLVQLLCHGCAVPPPPASPAELHHRGVLHQKSPPCVKGDVGGADRGIVFDNPSAATMLRNHPRVCCAALTQGRLSMEERQHIPLHRGGLVLKAPLQELKSKKAPLWGVLHQKSPPCVKGEVDAVDRGIVT